MIGQCLVHFLLMITHKLEIYNSGEKEWPRLATAHLCLHANLGFVAINNFLTLPHASFCFLF